MDELSKQLFGKRSIQFIYEAEKEALVKQAEVRLFGRKFSAGEYAEIVAALENAVITVDHDAQDDVIVISTTHPFYQEEQVRTIGIMDNKKTIENILFGVARPPAPRGVGARIAARQIEMARRLGFEQVILTAGGRPNDAFSGYYVWPRLGYNMNISDLQFELEAVGFVGVRDTNTLMRRLGGAEWWKSNGRAGQCIFDLRPDAPARFVLEAYLDANNIFVTE